MPGEITLAITQDQRHVILTLAKKSDRLERYRYIRALYTLRDKGIVREVNYTSWTLTAAGKHLALALKLLPYKAASASG